MRRWICGTDPVDPVDPVKEHDTTHILQPRLFLIGGVVLKFIEHLREKRTEEGAALKNDLPSFRERPHIIAIASGGASDGVWGRNPGAVKIMLT